MSDQTDAPDDEDLCPGFSVGSGHSAALAARGCRPSPTCSSALAEATKRWPGRNRASDGICGDPAHQARKSDHNPDASGYAHAYDLTHDPKRGLDTHRLADQLRQRAQSGQERRIKYVISNRRIASGPGWAWRAYSGANGHVSHMHVSVTSAATHDTSPWFAFLAPPPPPPPPPPPDKVRPMFDPPHVLQPIVDAEPAPEGGVILLGQDGSIYAYGGATFFPGANGKPWFAGRKAAKLDHVGGDRPWRIIANTGEEYHLPVP